MRYLRALPLALTLGSSIAPFGSGAMQTNLVVHLTQGAGRARVPVQQTEMYIGSPSGFIAPLNAPSGVQPELMFGIRAWSEAGKARVVVYAVLTDKRTPSGRTETPIATFLIASKQSVEVKEAHVWGAPGLVVSVDDQNAIQPVDYDSFCKQDLPTKELVLAKMPAEHRVTLSRTHLERWLEANRALLTSQQVAAVQTRIEKANLMDRSVIIVEQDMARAKAFETPPVNFTRAQLDEMSLAGPCIAKK